MAEEDYILIQRLLEVQAEHRVQIKVLLDWKERMEHKSSRITVALIGGVITLLAALVAAIMLAGLGVGAAP